MTFSTQFLLFISVPFLANSQPTNTNYNEQQVLIDSEITLRCAQPLESADAASDETQLVWEYSKNREHDQKEWFYIVAMGGQLDLNRGTVNHLDQQIFETNEQDLIIRPKELSASGIYKCKQWGSKQALVAYRVTVIAKPEIKLTNERDVMVAGQKHRFICEARGAFPAPAISWYWNGQIYSDGTPSEESETTSNGLHTLVSTIDFSLASDYTQDKFELECRAIAASQSWQDQTQSNILEVEFAPSTPQIENTVVLGNSQTEHLITCGTEVEAKPVPEYEWVIDPRMKNYTTIIYNKLAVYNVPLSMNKTSVMCRVKNKHGSEENSVDLVVVETRAEESTKMGSNTILMIGVIVAAVLLAALGGIVTYRRCSQQADYQTREDGKTAGPDGISYEQNPEVEALAPGEEKVQKELLM